MSISFTQSMQSLHSDQGHSALWGVGLAMFFLCLWLLWFLTPSLTVHVHGHLVKLTRSGTVLAEMPVPEGATLQAGQTAYIHPSNTTTPQPYLPATVLEVTTRTQGDQIQITLYPSDDTDIAARFAGGVNGEVQVEVATISPAQLLLQTLGQWGAAPPISLSP